MTRSKEPSKVTLKKDYKKMAETAERENIKLSKENINLRFEVVELDSVIQPMDDILKSNERLIENKDIEINRLKNDIVNSIDSQEVLTKEIKSLQFYSKVLLWSVFSIAMIAVGLLIR